MKSGTFTTNAAGELHVARHDGHALGVDGAKIRIFKETHKIGLGRLLKSQNCRSLEPQISLELCSHTTTTTDVNYRIGLQIKNGDAW